MVTTNPHPLDGARKRIERANKHLNEIISIIQTDASEYQDSLAIERDEIKKQFSVVMPARRELPRELPLAASDCIHNLRVALEYLIFELSREVSGHPNPVMTQFPLCEIPDNFEAHRVGATRGRGPLAYLMPPYIDRINAYQPYKGVAWAENMRVLSSQDKHRNLIIMNGFRQTDITDGIGETLAGVGPDKTNVQMERKTTTLITFSDGQPVVQTLETMKHEVALVIDSFWDDFSSELAVTSDRGHTNRRM
ncbi:MAG: hypothetical protein QOE77_1944 [Blastocatellia bacterium]|nr:hypothetical protein [Blastocatellia bacterium]